MKKTLGLLTVFTGFAFGAPRTVLAGDKEICIDAHAGAQVDRREGHLRAAREKLLICAAEVCPGVIRSECAETLTQVMRDLPTVVFSAKDASGHDIVAVRITEGTALLSDKLDGKTVPMDPGSHKLVATLASGEKVEVETVVRTGDRNLPISIAFGKAGATPNGAGNKADSPKPADSEKPAQEASRSIPATAWVAGGVAVVGLGLFAGFALGGKSKEDSFDTCKPYCAKADYDAMKRSYLFADISLGVGVVAAGLATYLFIAKPGGERTKETAGVWLGPKLGPQGGGLDLAGRF